MRRNNPRILKIETKRDEDNRKYISYCEYHNHPGIIINDKKCIKRKCFHYRKLYLVPQEGVTLECRT